MSPPGCIVLTTGVAPSQKPFTAYENRVIGALRAVREASGVDQIPLSRAAELSRNTYGRIERGERHADIDQLSRIMTAMTDLAVRQTNVRSLYDLLAYAEGKISLTVEQRRDEV